MTTYTLSGYQARFAPTDAIESIQPAQISLVVSQGDEPTFSYEILQTYIDGPPDVAFTDAGSVVLASATGFGNIGDPLGPTFYEVGEVIINGQASYYVSLNSGFNLENQWLFQIGGVPWPVLSTPAIAEAFVAQVQSVGEAPPSSGFGPNQLISVLSIPGVTVTEVDDIEVIDDITVDLGLADDTVRYWSGNSEIEGGAGTDLLIVVNTRLQDFAAVYEIAGGFEFVMPFSEGTLRATGFESFNLGLEVYTAEELRAAILDPAIDETGDESANLIEGSNNDDRLVGLGGDDTIYAGNGRDTINGGDGNDVLIGGENEADLRDIIYAGDGNDSVDGGFGNDLIFGMEGNDTIAGGFGVDELNGQNGDDVLTGSAFSDLLFGGAGSDFINGGFGFDRVNGGDDADRFYHIGIADHGSDWIQDYDASEGDILLFGLNTATADDFQVNVTTTLNAGEAGVQEAFVIYRPTGQIMWALVDGDGQSQINLQISGSAEVFDLLA